MTGAPKVTEAEVNANIINTEIVEHVSHSGQILRWAILTTQNGFAVTGRPSASVSPLNDDPKLGEEIAVKNAKNELWPMMGYALRERLMREQALLDSRAFEEGWDQTVYIGTKVVHANPMTRGEYNEYRGWTVPANEDPADEGYLVEYTDEKRSNAPLHKGYVSWSPKDVFERAYRAVGAAASAASEQGSAGGEAKPETHLDRMIQERHDLANKIQALDSFIEANTIFQNLNRAEQSDLKEQSSYMRGYLILLDRRLARAGMK